MKLARLRWRKEQESQWQQPHSPGAVLRCRNRRTRALELALELGLEQELERELVLQLPFEMARKS